MDSQRAVTIAGSRDAARANPDGEPNADARANPDAGDIDPVLARARDVLANAGVRARVERAGHAGEILVVHAPPSALDTLHSASDELRALGFRYVTIDVTNA